MYADVDLSPLMSVETLLSSTSERLLIPYGRHMPELNPTFIVAPPNHPFMLATVTAYARMKEEGLPISYWGWSIVKVMTAINEYGPKSLRLPRVLKEHRPARSLYSIYIYSLIDGAKVLLNRSSDYNPVRHEFSTAD